MKINKKLLALCVALPLAVGGLSAWLTRDSMALFETISKPPLSPPGWLFPVVWTILYILMGVASYMVLVSGESKEKIREALGVYGIQLAVNFFWSIFFFHLELYLFSFIWLMILWLLIILTTVRFCQITKAAGYLMIPYLLWVTFAAYLNFGIYLLNK